MLTVRAFQIANKILTMKRSVRIKDLSKMFHVSERSIKYDLDNIRYFFEDYELEIKSQSGKGIWIDCVEEKREEVIRILAKLQKENLYYNQAMRIHLILLRLFMTDCFVTAAELAEQLNVNRNTILSDMDSISMFLEKTAVSLERKQRTGYRLNGKEQDLRYFFEVQIQKSLSVYDIYLMTERIKYGNFEEPIRLSLPDCYTHNYRHIEETMHKLFLDRNVEQLQKENITLIIIRLMLSIVRVRLGCRIGGGEELKEEEQGRYYLYSYWAEIFRLSGLPILRDEVYYLEGRQDRQISDVDIALFTTDLIKTAEEKGAFHYGEDNTLYSRILSHLTLSLREEIKENPFNNSILKNHSRLFLAVKEVCYKHLPNNQLIYNDSFISYIVLHFLMSQRNIRYNRKLKAVLVCATGRGAARLIQKKIEAEIREIEMVANCSLVEAEHVISTFKPDYVISIFPMDAPVPVVVVESVPTRENIEFIRALVQQNMEDKLIEEDAFDELLDFDPAIDSETVSQQVIMDGLNIYNHVLQSGHFKIKEGLEFAFLTHIMLLAQRRYFDKQYTNSGSGAEGGKIKTVRDALRDIGVHINNAEIQALLNYFN